MVTEEERNLKKFLYSATTNAARIKDIKSEIENQKRIEESTRELSPNVADGLPHGNALGDPVANAALKIICVVQKNIDELSDELSILSGKTSKLRNLLAELSADERSVVELRYFDGLRWADIYNQLHISRATCFRLHDGAIRKMLVIYKN